MGFQFRPYPPAPFCAKEIQEANGNQKRMDRHIPNAVSRLHFPIAIIVDPQIYDSVAVASDIRVL